MRGMAQPREPGMMERLLAARSIMNGDYTPFMAMRANLRRAQQQQDLLDQQQQFAEGMANTEHKQGLQAAQQQRQSLVDAGVPEHLIGAMLLNPETAGSAISQQMDPYTLSPGQRRENPLTGDATQGNPRYYPVQPGGSLVLDPGYNSGQPQSMTPQTYPEGTEIENDNGDVMIMRGGQWVPAGGSGGNAAGPFRRP